MTSRWIAAHSGYMRVICIRSAFVGMTLVLALTGCGRAESEAAEPAQGGNLGDGSSGSEEPSVDKQEQITPGGIAAIVLQHLGPDAVRKFVTYEPEPGSVSVMVQLRDGTPHNFGVQVYSPEQAELFSAAGQCPRRPKRKAESCRTLENGTTVTTRVDAGGFSDDNVEGMVISGTAIAPEDGGALVMYENYDDSPTVSVADLEDLLTDPQLTWLTNPAVNKAGEDIDVKDSTG